MTLTETLDKWKSEGDFIYNDRVVRILYFVPYTGSSGNDFEVYFTDGSSLITDAVRLSKVIEGWHPIHSQAVLLAKEQNRKATVLDGDIITELRDTVMSQIRRLKESPDKDTMAQSKSINDSIGTLVNLARTELEYRRHAAQMNKNK